MTLQLRTEYVGWYAVDSSEGDYYQPGPESEGPHASYADAKQHAGEDQIIRYLAQDGCLYVDEPEDTE